MPKLPPIEADPEALPKVFHHLIGNAIKYTPDGGTITISGHPATNDSEGITLEGIEIIISDSGVGIDPEFHELIFTKFYQTGELALHSTGKSKFMGAGPGLGLAIARGIVEAHRGKLWVESPGFDLEACPGSRFHLFLPLRHPKPKRSPVTSPAYEGELTKSLLS
jgi:signal transduction histidine kinase